MGPVHFKTYFIVQFNNTDMTEIDLIYKSQNPNEAWLLS